MVNINCIHLTFVDADIRNIHLEEILQMFYKIKDRNPVYFFLSTIHHIRILAKKFLSLNSVPGKCLLLQMDCIETRNLVFLFLFGSQEASKTV